MVKAEKILSNALEKFIDEQHKEMIAQCPCYALTPSVVGYNEMKNPSKDYQSYLLKVKEHFDDYCLRQIFFVCTKLSIRKYYPEKSHIIEPYKSERMSVKDLDNIISELGHISNHGKSLKE